MSNPSSLPKFDDLPLNKGDPWLSAWGLYGKHDELGTLNRLTNEVVLEAVKEIKTGTRISLNWALDAQTTPFFGRQGFAKNVYQKPPRCVNDDVWTFNTQSSSQWDGLRHFAYQKEQKFYNGVTLEDIHGPNKTNVNGIHAWSKHGIVGRGILLDIHSYHQSHPPSTPYDPFESHSIRLSTLLACARAQNTTIKHGDILFIRSGYTATFATKTAEELKSYVDRGQPPRFGGVEQSEDVLRWIWENFSAVAGDMPSFECWPSQQSYLMHEVLLAGWGCPIGEMFDLEALAEECKKQNRWSFFLTSEVVNVPGGVASPPNALAIL